MTENPEVYSGFMSDYFQIVESGMLDRNLKIHFYKLCKEFVGEIVTLFSSNSFRKSFRLKSSKNRIYLSHCQINYRTGKYPSRSKKDA